MTDTAQQNCSAGSDASAMAPISAQRRRRAKRMARRPQRLALGPSSDHAAEIIMAIEIAQAFEIFRAVTESRSRRRDEVRNDLERNANVIKTERSDPTQVKRDTPAGDDAQIDSSVVQASAEDEALNIYRQSIAVETGRGKGNDDGVVSEDISESFRSQLVTPEPCSPVVCTDVQRVPGAVDFTHPIGDILSIPSYGEDKGQILEDPLPDARSRKSSDAEVVSSASATNISPEIISESPLPATTGTSLMLELTELFPDLKDVSDCQKDVPQETQAIDGMDESRPDFKFQPSHLANRY